MEHKQSSQPTSPAAVVVPVAIVILFFGVVLLGTLGNRTVVPYTPTVVAQVQITPTLMRELPQLVRTTYSGIDVSNGKSQFGAVCSGCHASDARGVAGLGKNLVDSEFVQSMDDDELFNFIIVGRPAWDRSNTTGIDMPARGGNPALTDKNIYQIIAYIRTLHDPSLIAEPGSLSSETVIQPTRTPVEIVGTQAPFAGLDLSGLSAPGAATATNTSVPEATKTPIPVVGTQEPFKPLDLSGLSVPATATPTN